MLEASSGRWEVVPHTGDEPLRSQLNGTRLAVVGLNGAAGGPRAIGRLLNELERTGAVAVVMLPAKAGGGWASLSGRQGQFLCVREDIPADELAWQLSAAEALQPAIQNLRNELSAARRIASDAAGDPGELDEEMRLAARLQRDFLPRRLPEVGPVRFAVYYRPASWVSGDIYDVARLDEQHVGFYVADAVGHGLPAALLTMFIKKALQTKRIFGNTYQIVPPHVSLSQLNTDICEQNLSSCQFCTCVYGVLNAFDLTLSYCRAGHPEPFLVRADGSVEILSVPGGLLGVFPAEEFQSQKLHLAPGDRLILYTDGVEEVLCGPSTDPRERTRNIQPLAAAPRDKLLLQLAERIQAAEGGRQTRDDITVVVVDVEP